MQDCFELETRNPKRETITGGKRVEINSQETIKRILDECRTVAVVGLSSDPMRPSNSVSAYIKRQGYRVIPVNPNETEVLGEQAYPSLSDVPEPIDLVDIFRRSSEAGAAVDEAIRVGAKAVWLQEGVIDRAAAQRAADAGLLVVMDRCWLKEHLRYGRERR
ncbi:MAG: CoA-binding protein [Pyrinomonadaceae bacterium]|nr:CoA-binding protein [Pyrinomonadaceae bacterium]